MKTSISVPDELWQRAKARRPELNASHMVQEALEAFAAPAAPGSEGWKLVAGVEQVFEAARERLAAQARREFEEGYNAAIVAGEEMEWRDVEALAEARFDITAWVAPYINLPARAVIGEIPEDEIEPAIIPILVHALGNMIPPWGDDSFTPHGSYLRGFARGMRDLFEAVVAAEGASPSDEEVAAPG
jgi:hypothetical protein